MGTEGRPPTPHESVQAVDEGLASVEATISSLIEGPGEERIKRKKLDFISTHIPGFYLVVASGDDAPDMRRGDEQALAKEVRIYYLRNQFIKRLQKLQEPLRKRLIDRAMKNDRLRGGIDEAVGGEVELTPNLEIDLSLVQESAGEKAGEFIHSKTIISFELDPERDDVDGIEKAVKRILKRRGKDPEIVERDNVLELDRDKFLAAAKRGDISLVPGTITVPDDPSKWRATPKPFVTSAEVVRAINSAAENLGLNNPEDLDGTLDE